MKNNKTDELTALLEKSQHLTFSDIEMKPTINNIEALLNKRKYLKNLPKKLISNISSLGKSISNIYYLP